MSDTVITTDTLLAALAHHIGHANAIHGDHLVVEITGSPEDLEYKMRRLRHCIVHLRRQGSHICGHPGSGYYLAANWGELRATCAYLYARNITGFEQIAAMMNVALPDLKGQLRLDP